MERIYFNDKSTNYSKKREGILIGDYLAVTQEAEIFKINTGKKLLESNFSHYKEAISFVVWLEEIYGKYFILWERWEDVNIFGLARYTVKNGMKILDILDRVESGEITKFEQIKENINGNRES